MPDALPITAVHHISHITANLDASRAFYQDVLGFRSIQRPNFKFAGAWLFNYGVQVHLIVDEAAAQREHPVSTRVDHIAFHVNDTTHVESLLQQHGIEYRVNQVADTGVTQLFFCDPDGNHIEIGCYPPPQQSTDG